MEAACASISIDLLSYYDLFDTTIAHADDVLSFMASMGVVMIVAFIDIRSVPCCFKPDVCLKRLFTTSFLL